MRFLITVLSGLALASAVAVPAAAVTKVATLVYGDAVKLDLSTGCTAIPKSSNDNLPGPSLTFTKLNVVKSGFTCEIHHDKACKDATTGSVKYPATLAEYMDGPISVLCKVPDPDPEVSSSSVCANCRCCDRHYDHCTTYRWVECRLDPKSCFNFCQIDTGKFDKCKTACKKYDWC